MIKEFVNRWETQQNSEEDSKADSQGDHSAKDNDISQVATNLKRKRESEPTMNAPSTKKKTTGAEVHAEMEDTTSRPEEMADTISESETDPEKISEEEKIYMETVAVEVKQMFRQVCFAKWSKDWLPVLVLSPYDVPQTQKEFRDEWKKKYTRYSEQKSKKFMEHLFIWYGCKNDSEAYGWAREKEWMSYEEAKEKGLTVIPKRITQKQTSGKTLTKGEQQMLDGFSEAKDAVELTLAERFSRHPKKQVDKEDTQEELGDSKDEEKSDEEPVIPKLLPKKNRLQAKKKDTNLKSRDDQPVPPKKVIKKKTQKAKPATTSRLSPERELPSPKKAVSVVDDNFVDNEISSKDGGDEDDESFKGDEEELSSEYEVDTAGKKPTKEKPENKKPKNEKPEKKKGRATSEKPNEKVESNQAKGMYLVTKEKAEFDKNEKEVLPIMHKLNDAVTKKDKEEILFSLDKIKSVVPKIAPSFVELHQIGMLIKRTRKTYGDAEVTAKAKAITDAMKLVYNNKRERRPKSFKLTWEACNNKLNQDENKVVVDATEVPPTFPKQDHPLSPAPELKPESRGADFSVPRKSGISSEMVAAPALAVESNPSVIIKPKKPKFSLGAMI